MRRCQLYLSSTAGPGSKIEGQLLYDDKSVGLVGPFGPGALAFSESKSKNLDFGALDTNPTLSADFELKVGFRPGVLPARMRAAQAPRRNRLWPYPVDWAWCLSIADCCAGNTLEAISLPR